MFDESKGGHTANGKAETLLTGTDLEKATAAATAKVSGATVLRAETEADGKGTYEVHMRKSDGSTLPSISTRTSRLLVQRMGQTVQDREVHDPHGTAALLLTLHSKTSRPLSSPRSRKHLLLVRGVFFKESLSILLQTIYNNRYDDKKIPLPCIFSLAIRSLSTYCRRVAGSLWHRQTVFLERLVKFAP